MRALLTLLVVLTCAALPARAQQAEPTPEAFRADALSIEGLINSQYAYLDRFPGGAMPISPVLRAEAEAVSDRRSLLRYAERAVAALADHHAITGGSFNDSWGLVPSYSDLWIEPEGDLWRITAVRQGSPAEVAGVRPGDTLVAVGDTSTAEAVAAFWTELGLEPTGDRAGYAARVLAAGRRDRPRDLTIRDAAGAERRLTFPNLYEAGPGERPPISTLPSGEALIIRFNDSLGDSDTVAAFDAIMTAAQPDQTVVLDLRDTASGGNTVVARGIMGWFVDEARPYQIHRLPAEERETGVPRQWVEQVLPRPGKRHHGPVVVRVGRWTGSMGEGLAIGLDSLDALVVGEPMAGLLGAIHDHRLSNSGLVIKLPTERLYAVDGTPREAFVPAR
ncbi:S41 family peptidase [Brevundimonas sp. UBA2416]|uniref:S41 family peptidase n=1 Tax=Brevundimonas sp. UBA2416 TaxID=1946124 RepID=UPI0025B8E5B2|nr:S41 family peptidase [Brevundimonas sp. UBA2416]